MTIVESSSSSGDSDDDSTVAKDEEAAGTCDRLMSLSIDDLHCIDEHPPAPNDVDGQLREFVWRNEGGALSPGRLRVWHDALPQQEGEGDGEEMAPFDPMEAAQWHLAVQQAEQEMEAAAAFRLDVGGTETGVQRVDELEEDEEVDEEEEAKRLAGLQASG